MCMHMCMDMYVVHVREIFSNDVCCHVREIFYNTKQHNKCKRRYARNTTHKMLLSHSHLGSTSTKIKCCERAIYWPALATDLLVRLPIALLAPDRAILHLVATSALLPTD